MGGGRKYFFDFIHPSSSCNVKKGYSKCNLENKSGNILRMSTLSISSLHSLLLMYTVRYC